MQGNDLLFGFSLAVAEQLMLIPETTVPPVGPLEFAPNHADLVEGEKGQVLEADFSRILHNMACMRSKEEGSVGRIPVF